MIFWQRKKTLFIFFTIFLIVGFFFYFSASAENQSGSLNVDYNVPGHCGNGTQEWDESCDNGVYNGACPQSCSLSCTRNSCGGGGDTCTGDCTNPTVDSASANPSYNSAVISWTAHDNVQISKVIINYGTISGNYPLSVTVDNGSATVNFNSSTTLTGLTAETDYYYQVVAYDSSGRSNNNGEKTFRTLVAPVDNTPPVISNIVITTGTYSASISFDTDEDAKCTVYFGLTTDYGSNSAEDNYLKTHSLTLPGLLSNTTYHYVIEASDSSAKHNSRTTPDATFTTLRDSIAPPNVGSFNLTTSSNSIYLTWVNPDLSANSDFRGVKILRKTSGQPNGYNDSSATLVTTTLGSVNSFNDTSIAYSTHYYYAAYSFDTSGNYSTGAQKDIISAPRTYAPQEVKNYYISTSTGVIILNWENPTDSMPNFQSVRILRKIGGAPGAYNDATATAVYSGNQSYYEDRLNLELDKHYYYKIFTFNGSSYSSGIGLNIIYTQPAKVEICGNNIDDDNNGLADCRDSACANLSTCIESNCSNGVDDDGDNLTDCFDTFDCSNNSACRIAPPENCNNKIDDDNDGAIDCADSDCARVCQQCVGSNCGGTGSTAQCSDSQDNDGDGLVDYPKDLGCTGPDDNDEYNPPPITTSTIDLSDIIFSGGNGKIIFVPQNNSITGLASFPVSVSLSAKKITGSLKNLALKIDGGGQYNLVKNSAGNLYYTGIAFPDAGTKQAFLEASYEDGSFDYVKFNLVSYGWGRVIDDQGNNLGGISLKLLDGNGNLFDLSGYGEQNPFLSNSNGYYAWLVPNGRYQITASAEGYFDRDTGVFEVSNHIINREIQLIIEPKKIEEVIDPEASLTENIGNVAQNLVEQTKALTKRSVQKVGDITKNPDAQQTAQNVVAPTAVSVVAASSLPFLNVANFIAWLRWLFLQPLLLMGRRKRVKWGQVYNSLNKLPVDLAIVRLLNIETNKIVQTQVTDIKGRYAFIVAAAGKYRIEAQKSDFVFPSLLLKDFKTDGQKMDLYHGETIEVSQAGAIITANIPLDVENTAERPRRLVFEKIGRIVQKILSPIGFLAAIVSYFLKPSFLVGCFLAIHILLFFLVRRLAKPVHLKGWGIVYDAQNNRPVTRAVARLFNLQLNKLVSTQITDKQGRYYFLAGNGKYSISVEHDGYYTAHSPVIDLQGEDADVIEEKIPLQHKDSKPEGDQPIVALPSSTDILPEAKIEPEKDPEIKPPGPENDNILG